jgi:hypothetical protein
MAAPKGEAEVMIPNYQQDARNGVLWNPKAGLFTINSGDAVTVDIQVRPGAWNAFRTAVGWPAFYVIPRLCGNPEKPLANRG